MNGHNVAGFVSSSWRDTNTVRIVPANYLAWNTVRGNNITPGSGAWSGTYWSQGLTTDLRTWVANSSALFSDADGANYNITAATANVDTMRFESNGYTIAASGTAALTMHYGRVVVLANKSATIGAVLAGSSGLHFSGGGTLTLNGANTYTGATNITAGTLVATGTGTTTAGPLGAGGAVTVTADGAKLQLAGATLANGLTIGSGNLVSASGSNTVNGAVTLNGASTASNTIDVTASLLLGGVVSGSTGGITKTGTGTLTLGGANTYSGATTVSAGTLQVGNGAAGQVSGNISAATGTTVTFNRSNEYTYAGVISGVGNVTKTGAGTVTLSGTNTYTGTTTVSAGTLKVAGAGNLGTGTITAASGGTLEVNHTSATAATFGKAVSGAGKFLKSGAGTLNVTAAVSTTNVEVSGGKLAGTATVGASGSIVTASADGTLAGNNYTGTVTASGALEADSSMKITGALTLNAASTVNVKLTAAMKTSPRIDVSGAATLSGAKLNITTGASGLADADTGTYQILRGGTISGATNNFGGVTVNGSGIDGFTLTTTVAGGVVTLRIVKLANTSVIKNPLTVEAVEFVSESDAGSTVKVTVSGFDYLRPYSNTNGNPRIDGVYIWYKPGAGASSGADTAAGGGRFAATSFPTTGDVGIFNIIVPKSKGSLDTLYFFNANVYWVADNVTSLPNAMGTTAKSVYTRDPKGVVLPNGLTIAVESVDSDMSGVKFNLVVAGQDAAALNSGLPYKPRVDSVGVWYKRNGPLTLAQNNNRLTAAAAGADGIRTFPLAALRSNGRFSIDLPAVTGNNIDSFYFAVAPRWTGADIDSIARPLFSVIQKVADPNKKLPNNPCLLSAVQTDERDKFVKVTVSVPANEPFNELAKYVNVAFAFDQAMTDSINILDQKSVSDIPDTGWVLTLENVGFVGKTRRVYWKITVSDADGNEVDKRGTFSVGREPPLKPANVTAEPLGHGRLLLNWAPVTAAANNIGDIGKSIIFIAYSKDPLSADMDFASPPTGATVKRVPATSVEYRVDSLEGETDYWFAIALRDSVSATQPTWNLTSDAAAFKQNSGDWNIASNILEITDVTFNAETLNFTVFYKYTADNNETDTRFSYRVILGSDTVLAPEAPLTLKPGIENTADTLRGISIGDAIMFDTTYLVALFTVDAAGNPAIGVSVKDVRIGPFASQKVTITRNETRYVDNRRFGISTVGWSETYEGYTFPIIVDTSTLGGSAWGFTYIDGAGGYRYKATGNEISMLKLANFTIRMAADEIPAPYTADNVKIYRWAGSFWEVLHDTKYENGYFTGTALDNALDDSLSTYRLLISTEAPRIQRNTTNPNRVIVMSDGDYEEAFSVISNIGNARVKFISAPAKQRADDSLRLNEILPNKPESSPGTTRSFAYKQPVSRDWENCGILAYLIVSDGVTETVMNVSRQVDSYSYDGFPAGLSPETEPKTIWLPFAAQVDVDNENVRDALEKALFGTNEVDGISVRDTFKTLDTLFRLVRWYPSYTGDGKLKEKGKENWVEYNGQNDSIFAMKPGNLMWIKTASKATFDFGPARTVRLVDTFEIRLPSKQWTDFVLPFQFDIRLGDVLAATGAPIQLYRWKKMVRNKTQEYYNADPLSLVTPDSTVPLRGGSDPFTVWNEGSAEIVLRIPPTPAFMSRHGGSAGGRLAKRSDAQPAAGGLWYYTIRAATESTPDLASVMVGYSASKRLFAVPPSFLNESVTIVDDDGNGSIGHYFGPDMSGGRTLKLRFYNGDKRKTTFTFSAKETGLVPAGTQVKFVNAATGQDLAARGFDYAIAVNGMSHEDVYMVIGGGEYRNRIGAGASGAKFTVSPISVNQIARSARVKFYIPLAGIDRVEISAYDIKGRMVWKSAQPVRRSSWNTMEWNSRQSRGGAVSAGMYIIRIKGFDAKGRVTAVENRRLTFAR